MRSNTEGAVSTTSLRISEEIPSCPGAFWFFIDRTAVTSSFSVNRGISSAWTFICRIGLSSCSRSGGLTYLPSFFNTILYPRPHGSLSTSAQSPLQCDILLFLMARLRRFLAARSSSLRLSVSVQSFLFLALCVVLRRR